MLHAVRPSGCLTGGERKRKVAKLSETHLVFEPNAEILSPDCKREKYLGKNAVGKVKIA